MAQKLCERYELQYVHNSVPDQSPFDFWMKDLRQITGKGAVIDRLHWSNDVYEPIPQCKSQGKLDEHDRWVLEGWLMAHGCVVVRCQPPLEVCLVNCAKEDDIEGNHKEEITRQVYAGYEKDWATNLEVFDYDYTRDTVEQVYASLDHHDAWMVSLGFDVVGIGSPTPAYVFVGERHNPKRLDYCKDPTVFRASSGDYLRKALNTVELPMEDYFITNAYLEDGTFNASLHGWAVSAMVVPMGREAQRALRKNGIKTTAYVPHPQYARRFRFSHLHEYGESLLAGRWEQDEATDD